MKNGYGVVFIVDENGRFISVINDGDIRRGILKGKQLADNVMTISSDTPFYVLDNMSKEEIAGFINKKNNLKNKIQYGGTLKVPVLDKNKLITNVLFISINDSGVCIIDHDCRSPNKMREIKKNKNILVTGGAGYLGSILCKKLLDNDYKVKVLDNLMYGDHGIRQFLNNPNFKLIKGDIRNIQIVVESIKDVDAVIHLAAIVGDPATTKFPQESIDVNYLATKAIVEVCKYYQVNRFIFASTCSVYGYQSEEDSGLTINSKLNPLSLYAKMKLESEKAILSLADDYFSPLVLRMATLYGLSPRMRFDLAVNFLSAEAVIKKEIVIFGGSQWRPFLHVEDAANAYVKCLELPFRKVRKKILNLGQNNQNYQMLRVGRMIKKLIPGTKLGISKKEVDSRNYKVLFDDTVKNIDFHADYKVSDGIAEIRDRILEGDFIDYRDKKYRNV
ncbi:MAG: NAD-dependent epimerase/dehydratase family protein [Patescibacteria group bacterium]